MAFSVEFPLIGGPHQVFHVAPVAAALSILLGDSRISMRADTPRVANLARRAVSQFRGANVSISLLDPSPLGDALCSATRLHSLGKLPLMWANRHVLNAADAIVVPECTSTALRKIGAPRPLWFCIPHGAGDRAVSFEKRFRRFDHLLVAGEKTAAGMRRVGIEAERISIVGYPKGDLVERMASTLSSPFANDRKTVLYNPHFRRSLSSLHEARGVIAAFAAHPEFNLIFAPHIRAFENDPTARAEFEAMAVPDKVVIDCASDRLIDMSHVAAADIYLGDVSSQVYEFLMRPRPCVFINAHQIKWQGKPEYAFWKLGEVGSPAEVLSVVERACQMHPLFRAPQEAARQATFGARGASADFAATIIMRRMLAARLLASTAKPGRAARMAQDQTALWG